MPFLSVKQNRFYIENGTKPITDRSIKNAFRDLHTLITKRIFNDSTVEVRKNVISALDGRPYNPEGSFIGWNQLVSEDKSFSISQGRLNGNIKEIEDPKNQLTLEHSDGGYPASKIASSTPRKLYKEWVSGNNAFRIEKWVNSRIKVNLGKGDDFAKIYHEESLGEDSLINLGSGNDFIGTEGSTFNQAINVKLGRGKDFIANGHNMTILDFNPKQDSVWMGRGISHQVFNDRIEFEHGLVLLGITDFDALDIDYHAGYCPSGTCSVAFPAEYPEGIVTNPRPFN